MNSTDSVFSAVCSHSFLTVFFFKYLIFKSLALGKSLTSHYNLVVHQWLVKKIFLSALPVSFIFICFVFKRCINLLAMVGLCCYMWWVGPIFVVCGFLSMVASLVVEHRLLSSPVSLVGTRGLSSCLRLTGSEHSGLVILRHVVSSQIRDWTSVPCIARWILNHWTTRGVPCLYLFHLLPRGPMGEVTAVSCRQLIRQA